MPARAHVVINRLRDGASASHQCDKGSRRRAYDVRGRGCVSLSRGTSGARLVAVFALY